MAHHFPGTPLRHQPLLSMSIFIPPENPEKTEEYGNWGNAVVPISEDVESMSAFKNKMFLEDPFKLKKKLTMSDVEGSSRLLLQRDWVEQHILPLMNPHDAQLCREAVGKQFIVLDVNDDSSHHLTLKRWNNNHFVFTGKWVPNFVARKNLEAGDVIGIALFNGCFFLKLIKKKGDLK